MNKIKSKVIKVVGFMGALVLTTPAYAQIDVESINPNTPETTASVNDTVKNVINILLFVVGVGAVIMLIIGAIRYVVSAGDQQAVAGAKNTILYAIVGIVVAVMAFAIVNFVLGPQGLQVQTEE